MKRIDQKKKIINAAVKIFAQRGFFETRVEDIARRAGVAKGTVYLYFKDKPALYAGIVDEHFKDAIQLLKHTVDAKISPPEKLARIADNWVSYMLKFESGFGMNMVENTNMASRIMKSIHQQAATRVQQIIELIAQIIGEGVRKGYFVRIDPRIGAFYFLNMVRAAFSVGQFIPGIKKGEQEIIKLLRRGLETT